MQKAILELLKTNIKSRGELAAIKRKIAKKFSLGILLNSDILKEYQKIIKQGKLKLNPELAKILRKRTIRTMSGIAPVAVLTKPYACPGQCVYCPSEKNVPQSYLSNEPAVMRAIRCNYNPYAQVQMRLKALEANGHQPTKIELIVIGGTWSALPKQYQYWFITECFRAANEYNQSQKSKIKSQNYNLKLKNKRFKDKLFTQQRRNEKAVYRLIGITLETRPDYINEKELWQMRELGCTRVELGAQAIDDKILQLNKRGHGVAAIEQATKLLKNFGFKITYHLMPGLPGATAAKDFKMFKQLFSDERFQPDQIKFYPTVVTKGNLLYKWWKKGAYQPYSDKGLRNLIIKCKKEVPRYVRIIRLIRDIPKESIIAGNAITNLRQIMKDKGIECRCIRCREAKERPIGKYRLSIIKYNASEGKEYFISYESEDKKILYGFCRLRLPKPVETNGCSSLDFSSLDCSSLLDYAIIRELHIYGELVPVGQNRRQGGASKKIQHAGLGKKLMAEAEKIARSCGFKKIVVISGIGARDYYRKLGYKLINSYMVKNLK